MLILVALLVVWLVLVVVGFVVKSLLWLAILGIVLFIVTSLWGSAKRRGR